MEFLAEYGLFAAKTLTLLVAVVIAAMIVAGLASRPRDVEGRERLDIKRLNDRYRRLENTLRSHMASRKGAKRILKREKAKRKAREKRQDESRSRVFVLEFNGDLRASAVEHLREEITSVLAVAEPADEVVIRLESPGGVVPSYGLAASQLARVRDRSIPLTVTIDKVAASGGYLMACVADRILAAPFAVVGSVGVVGQVPNFHRLLKRHDIDYEMETAGEHKRTLTLFGENTDEGRRKFREELEDIHALFKEHIQRYRPAVDVDKVATGEYWLAERALGLGLVDTLKTSDDYLWERSGEADLYEIRYRQRKPLGKRLALSMEGLVARLRAGIY